MHSCNEGFAFHCTQRHVLRWLLHNRFLDWRIAYADGGRRAALATCRLRLALRCGESR